MTRQPADDLQRLYAEEPFVRALARQLAVDDADDVVQQTWLLALQQGGGGIERPRRWLARIVRNVAKNLRRGDRRRKERQRAVAVRDLVPSSAELMEREERRRALVEAVDALPPALRTVVLLRFFEGMPPRHIAREIGAPVATVWTQLHRALELLRQRLDAAHGGDRRAWLLPLVTFAPGSPPPIAPLPDPYPKPWLEPALPRGEALLLRELPQRVPPKPLVQPLPPVPKGKGGNPQPQDPPAREVDPGAGGGPDTGTFTYFKNQPVQPAGASRSTSSVVDPSSVVVRDTAFQTGNWYAALSRDSGQTWSHIDPFTFFPPMDGGFCCDQRVEYVRSHDITVWVLQYLYSPITGKGSYYIAVANGRDELRSGQPADWTLYEFDPADFGFPINTSLGSMDVGYNGDWLYLAANVHDGPTGAFMGAVVWRVSLYDLQQNGSVTYTWLTDATMGGNSYRFATRAGDGTNMYWASLMTTTSIRIWRQNTIGISRDYVDRTTAAWQSTQNACAGPNGRGWMGGAVGKIHGACGTASELTFAWTSDRDGTTARPLPYTRVARFRVSDRSLVQEDDVYSQTQCWAYAAIDSNSLGHIGGVIAIGGPTSYVRTSCFLVDQYRSWNQGIQAHRMGVPTNNPPGQDFGDYFDVQRNWTDEKAFVSAGTLMNGGDLNEHVEPHYVWFGRDDYAPTWVNLDVTSTPVQGVPIKIDVTDNNDRKNGTTNFRRTFAPQQGYELTAPDTFISGPTTFVFDRWVLNGGAHAIGQTVLTTSSIGTDDDVAEAQYLARRTITFDTSSHITSVGLTISPQDLNGQSNGSTVMTRQYKQGTLVNMTLPVGNVGGHPFKYWRIDGHTYPLGQLSVAFTIGGADSRATAVFYEHTPGTFTTYGVPCDGSNGPDVHFGNGKPEIGNTIDLALRGGPSSSATSLVVGASDQLWTSIPLPYALPGAPGCSVYASLDVTLSAPTNPNGIATYPIVIPNDTALIDGRLYTQYVSIDLGANQLGLTLSNGIGTLIGGVR